MLAPQKSKLASGSDEEYAACMKEHMLGVISTLNDMLQEVHGKQSIESKQKILRSFGEFAKQVGSAISNVAPQVCLSSSSALYQLLRACGLDHGNVADHSDHP